jgi:uncharacterized protein
MILMKSDSSDKSQKQNNMMKWIYSLGLLLAYLGARSQLDYPIHQVPFTEVRLQDDFWLPRIELNRTVTIPASFNQCRVTGRIRNFQMAAARSGKFCTAYPFDDTDIYKTIEGASYSLALHPDKDLDAYLDSLIRLIGSAQEPDGYLYTARTIDPVHPLSWSGPTRWVKEHDNSHELYCSGHLYEAAVAHFLATGKHNLLNIAIKNADLLLSVFGPGKMQVAPGHEIVEMGLVKMYKVTGKSAYLDLAKFFLEQRGERKYNKKSKNVWENGMYWQAHLPVTEQEEVVGHAVRAMYLYSAMTDIAALTGDSLYRKAVDQLWQNMVEKKMYLHGGIGAIGDGERFGGNYELPNLTAYAETCAAIGSVFWDERMFLLHGEAKYMDVLERTLYNGLLSGVGLDGKSFFYTNAMQVRNQFTHPDLETGRSGWFTCSCCPTNLLRLIPSMPGYIYAWKGDSMYVNLYVSSSVRIHKEKLQIELSQQSNYPWEGHIQLHLNSSSGRKMNLLLRIPGWSRNEAFPGNLYAFEDLDSQQVQIRINGIRFPFALANGYAILNRKWKAGDKIDLDLPMNPRKLAASPKLKEDSGKLALQRGPILYCAEWVDNQGRTSNLVLPESTRVTSAFRPELLKGLTVLEASLPAVQLDSTGLRVFTQPHHLVAIPYYAWANRGGGEMNIWFPSRIKDIELISKIQQGGPAWESR